MGEREVLAGRPERAAAPTRSGAWLWLLSLFAALLVVLSWYVPRWYAQQFAGQSAHYPTSTEPLAPSAPRSLPPPQEATASAAVTAPDVVVGMTPPTAASTSAPVIAAAASTATASVAPVIATPLTTTAVATEATPAIAAAALSTPPTVPATIVPPPLVAPLVAPLVEVAAMNSELTYLLRAAQARVLEQRDVRGAIGLLAQAETLLRGVSTTDNVALRSAIAADLAALRAVSGDDREAIFSRLAALDARWDALPLRLASFHPVVTQAPVATPTSAVSRLMLGAVSALSGVVRVRTDRLPGEKPLLDASQGVAARQAMHLYTQHAQLAVLRGRAEIYSSSLQAARRQLAAGFVANDVAVAQARAALTALAATDIAHPLPRLTAPEVLNAAALVVPTTAMVQPPLHGAAATVTTPQVTPMRATP